MFLRKIETLIQSQAVNGKSRRGSNHTGGVNAAFADGSVRFYSSNIDRTIWSSLCSNAGGEAVNAEQ